MWPGRDEFPATRACKGGGFARFHEWRDSWIKFNPGWELRFHRDDPVGDEKMDEILACPELTVVVKSDVLRWFVVWKHGGVYTDTDNECKKPLDALWLAHAADVTCTYEPFDWGTAPEGFRPHGTGRPKLQMLSPSIIVARPGAAFARQMVDRLFDVFKSRGAKALNHEPHVLTGPLAVTLAWDRRLDVAYALPARLGYAEYAVQHHTGMNTIGGWTSVDRLSDGTEVPRVVESREHPKKSMKPAVGAKTRW